MQKFQIMKFFKKIGAFPVGFAGAIRMEKPAISFLGRLKYWDVQYLRSRQFRSDMAGFAINLDLILRHDRVYFPLRSAGNTFETAFLTQFGIKENKIQLIAMNIKGETGDPEVLVWHTRTKKPNLQLERKYKKRVGKSSDSGWEI